MKPLTQNGESYAPFFTVLFFNQKNISTQFDAKKKMCGEQAGHIRVGGATFYQFSQSVTRLLYCSNFTIFYEC